ADYDRFLSEFWRQSVKPHHLENASNHAASLRSIVGDILEIYKNRIILFIDELDVLISLAFRDSFLGQIRAIFNGRTMQPELSRIQFVLASAARPKDFIQDPNISPFNVGTAINLADLTLKEIDVLCQNIHDICIPITSFLSEIIYNNTRGSIYLSQL